MTKESSEPLPKGAELFVFQVMKCSYQQPGPYLNLSLKLTVSWDKCFCFTNINVNWLGLYQKMLRLETKHGVSPCSAARRPCCLTKNNEISYFLVVKPNLKFCNIY